MSGLGEQGQAVGADSGHDQKHDVHQRYDQRNAQDPGSRRIVAGAGMDVHEFSLKGGMASLQPGCREPSTGGTANLRGTAGECYNPAVFK